MSDKQEREAIASRLMEHVKDNNIAKVESIFSHFSEDSQWRDIVRSEFNIADLMENTLLYDVVIPRLISYEIMTLSPFHYAAFKGHIDILVNFIDHDVPVDVSLASGTTGLQLAAFSGKADCVTMLVDVYKADVNKQDKYGWSALHYASTEGHMGIVRALIEFGVDTNLRDQDGTSAAFRAQVNGHEEIVDLLCEDEDDILNVDPAYEGKAPLPPAEGLYSTVQPKRARSQSTKEHSSEAGTSGASPVLRENGQQRSKAKRAQSEIVTSSRTKKSQTLPRNFMINKTTTIRRIIRKEIEEAMASESPNPDYMEPSDFSKGDQVDETEKFALAGVGVNTLKGIMREEMGRYAKEMYERSQSESSSQNDPSAKVVEPPKDDTGYEDIYETVKALEGAVLNDEDVDVPQVAPPLPPRNAPPRQLDIIEETESTTGSYVGDPLVLQNNKALESVALKESIKRIAPVLGEEWKRLVFALPLEPTKDKVQKRVAVIEKRHPNDVNKQAAMALGEWRLNMGSQITMDDLVLALRKCGFQSLIEEVERVSQEFTA